MHYHVDDWITVFETLEDAVLKANEHDADTIQECDDAWCLTAYDV